MGVPENKSNTIARKSTHMKTTVEQRQRFFQNRFDICLFRMCLIFIHQEVVDHFHHCRQVALFLKFARVNIDQSEEFISIYKIKIPCKSKIAGRNCVSFYKRMTKLSVIFSLCSEIGRA